MDLPPDLRSRLSDIHADESLRRGGQGELLSGRWSEPGHSHDGREVVLKVYQSHYKRDRIWNFWSAADERFVTRLLFGQRYGSHDFEVTERHRHGSLKMLIYGRKPMSAEQAELVLRQLTDALTHIGTSEMLHGDVKPGNILVRSKSPLHLVLVDFGVSHELEDGSVSASAFEGSALYVAPERRDGTLSLKSDWWSLGIVMLELLLGRYPFGTDRGGHQDVDRARFFRDQDIEAAQFIGDRADLGARWIDLIDGLLTRDHHQR